MPIKQKLNTDQYLLLFGVLTIIVFIGLLIFFMYKRTQRKIQEKMKVSGKYQIISRPQQTLLTDHTSTNLTKNENNINLSQINLKN